MTVREIAQMTNIDPWFLHQLKEIADVQAKLGTEPIDAERLREIKRMGFSDARLGEALQLKDGRDCQRENSSAAQAAQRPPGVQAGGHLRRRI